MTYIPVAERKRLAYEEAKKKVALIMKLRDENRICFFKPNPAQEKLLAAWDDPAKKVFTFTGANRIGKTTIDTVIGFSTMFGEWPWSRRPIKFPHNEPRKIRYVGQGWESHIKAVVEPELKKWWPNIRRVDTKKNNQGVEALWTDRKTKSTLEIMSNSQSSDMFEGWSGDLVIYDEPPTRDIRIACARGLIDRQGRELFGATLLKEAWLHREIVKKLDDKGNPDPSVFNIDADIYVNVGFGITEAGIEQFKKSLRPEEVLARIEGKPSYFSSLIWPMFDRALHLKDRFAVPLDWLVDIQIDFHPAKPWNILFLATDKKNFKYVVEGWKERGNPKYIAEQIIRRVKDHAYRVNSIEIDPLSKSGEKNDITDVFSTMYDVFAAHGFYLETASKEKDSGLVMVRDLLKTENDMPALFVFRDCGEVVTQMEDYMVDPDTLKPSKDNDDFCECLYRAVLRDTQWYPATSVTPSTSKSVIL